MSELFHLDSIQMQRALSELWEGNTYKNNYLEYGEYGEDIEYRLNMI